MAVELYRNKSTWKNAQLTGIDIINQIYDKEKIGPLFINEIKEIQDNLRTAQNSKFFREFVTTSNITSYKIYE